MGNPMYQQFGHTAQAGDSFFQLASHVKELQRTLRGNPRDMVQQLLNSGQMTQQQFNQYSQMANTLMDKMRGK